MRQLREDHLADVAVRLQPVPVNRWNEKLEEMRQHLQNAVTVNREFGQSENEVAADAMAHFGPLRELAFSLVGAWRRGKALKKRALWTDTSATPIILSGFLYLLCNCELLWLYFEASCNHQPDAGRRGVHASFLSSAC